jgi:arylsulfatase A-like enzyme
VVLAATAPPARSADPARRPNVVVILADDLGYGDLGCYGGTDARTPVLDRLAGDGARFTDAYAAGPLCSPTRVALLTGRYQQRAGHAYEDYMGGGFPGLDATRHPSVARLMKAGGYRTAVYGKWNVAGGGGEATPAYLPAAHGFGHWVGVHANHDQHTHVRVKQPKYDLWEDGRRLDRPGFTDDLLADAAVAFVGRHRAEPFFLYLPFLSPHNPLQTHDDPKVHPDGDRAAYVKMVERLDHNVGRVLAAIREAGLDADTLVMFTSDNGGQQAARNLPCSGRKGQLLEGGIRVPLIVRQPGVVPAGRTVAYPAITMDLTATALAAAGAAPPAARPLDGIDLRPVTRGEPPPGPRSLYWRQRKVDFRARTDRVVARAVREGDWKLHWRGGGEPRLFNLTADVGEARDLAVRHPDVAARLVKKLEAWERAVTPPEVLFGRASLRDRP